MTMRATLRDYFGSRDRGWVLTLLLAVGAVYLPFLGSPFVFDDISFFLGGGAAQYAHSMFQFDLRWLPYATLGWTELAFSNVLTHFFHLGNLVIHAANVIMLFYLLRMLARGVLAANSTAAGESPETARAITQGAWLGALVFALHPVAVYAVGYVVQRSILLATCFVLAMQLAYLRGLLSGRAGWLAFSALAYFLAVFSKEHSVMAPLLLAAETLLLRPQARASRRALWLTGAAYCAIALLIILRAKGVFGSPYEAMAGDLFKQEGVTQGGTGLHLLSVLTQMGLFFKYLLLWAVPNPAWMSIDMRETFIAELSAWQGWAGAAAFLLYGYAGARLLLRGGSRGLLGLALLYPWLQFLLEFSSIRVQEPFVLYRSYLWMPGLMLMIPLLLIWLPGKKTLAALGLVALVMAGVAVNRLWVFAEPYRLWDDAALLLRDDRVPGADRILFNRGQAAERINQWDVAVSDFERVVAISPQYAPVRFELGWAYLVKGRYDDAMAQFDAAIADDPRYANAYYGKAVVLNKRRDFAQAAEMMAKSCELKNPVACFLARGRATH